MLKLGLITLFTLSTVVNQPTTLQLIEEQIEKVLIMHCVEYERGSKTNGGLTDVQIAYTGNNTVDAKKDSTGHYFIFGTYTYDKYTNVNTSVFGNLPNQSYTKTSSTSYLAKVKQVLDDYRVQEIVIIEDPNSFEFSDFNFELLKSTSDMLFPEVIHRDDVDDSDDSDDEKKKDKKKKKDDD